MPNRTRPACEFHDYRLKQLLHIFSRTVLNYIKNLPGSSRQCGVIKSSEAHWCRSANMIQRTSPLLVIFYKNVAWKQEGDSKIKFSFSHILENTSQTVTQHRQMCCHEASMNSLVRKYCSQFRFLNMISNNNYYQLLSDIGMQQTHVHLQLNLHCVNICSQRRTCRKVLPVLADLQLFLLPEAPVITDQSLNVFPRREICDLW